MIGADILVMGGLFSDRGQFIFYGKTARTLITGNGDGVKHVAISTLHSLQHIDYAIPPSADAGWLGEIGPGPSHSDLGSGGPENDFTTRDTTFMTWNLIHTARRLKRASGIPPFGNLSSPWSDGIHFGFDASPEYR